MSDGTESSSERIDRLRRQFEQSASTMSSGRLAELCRLLLAERVYEAAVRAGSARLREEDEAAAVDLAILERIDRLTLEACKYDAPEVARFVLELIRREFDKRSGIGDGNGRLFNSQDVKKSDKVKR